MGDCDRRGKRGAEGGDVCVCGGGGGGGIKRQESKEKSSWYFPSQSLSLSLSLSTFLSISILSSCLCSVRESRGWELVFTSPPLEKPPQRIALSSRVVGHGVLGGPLLAAVLGKIRIS